MGARWTGAEEVTMETGLQLNCQTAKRRLSLLVSLISGKFSL